MTRPAVSVVMPFAGTPGEADSAVAALLALEAEPGDELILADNAGAGPASAGAGPAPGGAGRSPAGVRVIRVGGERSPSHARNVGAEHARHEWILFLDADCEAEPGLLEAYFATPVADQVGALAGEVLPAGSAETLPARYAAARGALGLGLHLGHPYLPRAVAANLLVRRAAFEAVGGFYEGVRAAEDTDFTWRLQRAGWRLEGRPAAQVRHRHRTTLRALRRQWRGYAAGRAWLSRRYEDFSPEPALRRAARRAGARLGRHRTPVSRRPPPPGRPPPPARPPPVGRRDRGAFFALDALLGLEELAGFLLSNRPGGDPGGQDVRVVVIAERFPARGDPLAEFARTLSAARVEAAARPEAFDPGTGREVAVSYREDEGLAGRLAAVARLLVRHPLRALRDRFSRGAGEPSLSALAPAVLRLVHEPGVRIHPLGGGGTVAVARRLAALSGRPLAGPGP